MAEEPLGPAFEIHGGGLDLVFPHHENELAQSRALGHPFAQIWAHNGMLRFTGEKMSKSVGNIATIREALDEWGRETILVFFLTGHWRKPIDFSDETMAQAAAQAESFRNVFRASSEPGGRLGRVRGRARRRLQHPGGARADARLARPRAAAARRSASSGSSRSPRRTRRPPRSSSWPSSASRRGVERDFDEADRLRAEIEAAGWEMRDEPTGGFTLVREAVSGELVYGRRAVREALRGRREVLELWATERAAAAEPWLAEAKPKLSGPSAS